jgi:hypothetical protein
MNEHDFIVWLNGFIDGVHEYNVTPKQWDMLRDKLVNVTDKSIPPFPSETPNIAPNTTAIWQIAPNPTSIWPEGHTINGKTTNTTTMYPSGSMWTYTDTFTNDIK